MRGRYDHRNCQSLFGYAQQVHQRSGGVCELCFAGRDSPISFDFWRQLTVEHLIGESQGGYLKTIRPILQRHFPSLSWSEREAMALRIDAANTITACSFCNATTSRDRNDKTMEEIITEITGTPDEIVEHIAQRLNVILEKKRADVRWKLESVREAFEAEVRPQLEKIRSQRPDLLPPHSAEKSTAVSAVSP
jgi:hypothetical protein